LRQSGPLLPCEIWRLAPWRDLPVFNALRFFALWGAKGTTFPGGVALWGADLACSRLRATGGCSFKRASDFSTLSAAAAAAAGKAAVGDAAELPASTSGGGLFPPRADRFRAPRRLSDGGIRRGPFVISPRLPRLRP